MAHAQTPRQSDAADVQRVEEHRVADVQNEDDENGGTDGRGRRRYQIRPESPRRTDLMGVNSTWWMALGWLILILLIVFPFPFWSW
jgi:hypothetical protein